MIADLIEGIDWKPFVNMAVPIGLASLVGLLVHLLYRRPRYRRQERILCKLAEMRTEGVKLRNQRPEGVFSSEDIDAWFKKWNADIEDWKARLYEEAEKFSPVEAERLRTLDTMTERSFRGVVTAEQLHTLLYVSETLTRLDRMLEQRFRPKTAP